MSNEVMKLLRALLFFVLVTNGLVVGINRFIEGIDENQPRLPGIDRWSLSGGLSEDSHLHLLRGVALQVNDFGHLNAC